MHENGVIAPKVDKTNVIFVFLCYFISYVHSTLENTVHTNAV